MEITADIALPVALSRFSAEKNHNATHLSWSTSSESNTQHFALERSADNIRFQEIAQVAAAGNSQALQQYAYTDRAPLPGANYYRLRQVDLDGAYAYSPVRSVVFDQNASVTIAPVPTDGVVRVQMPEAPAEPVSWELYDAAGRLLIQNDAPAETEYFEVDLSPLPTGTYVLRIVSGRRVWTERTARR